MPNETAPPGNTPVSAAAPNRRIPLIPGLFVSMLAFFLASFPARNADVWGHLAVGRDLLAGKFPTESPAWATDLQPGSGLLFDFVAYVTHAVSGGIGLTVFKSLLLAILAAILLALARGPRGWLLPVLGTGLAVLAMSQRLLLQPETVSYLFLGLACWALRSLPTTPQRHRFDGIWPLALIFLAWANTDRWFVIGLAVTAMTLVGRWLDTRGQDKSRIAIHSLVTVAFVIIACRLNPSRFAAFTIPPEFYSFGPMPGGAKGVSSPFSRAYYEAALQSPAAMAYFPLLGLSFLSFVLNLKQWHWERFLPWLLLAVASGIQIRTAPFFAVMAGPMLALNLGEYFHRRDGETTGTDPTKSSLLLRWGTQIAISLIGLVFLAAAWCGWLQSPPFEPRHWGIETPASLSHGPATLREWNAAGKLPANAGFLHLSPASHSAFAWFCPEIRSVRDPRLTAVVRGEQRPSVEWAMEMRAAKITHVVAYDTDRARLFATLDNLFETSGMWTPLLVDGRLVVFAWRDPQAGPTADTGLADLQNPDRLAFREDPSQAETPASPPAERRWTEAFWKRLPVVGEDRDEAAIRLIQAEALRRRAIPKHRLAWESSIFAGLAASMGGWSNPAGPLLDATQHLLFLKPDPTEPGQPPHPLGRLAISYQPAFVQAREDSPASLMYLAIRSARRAIARNPRDAQAYASLGEAYLRLLHNSREKSWGIIFNELIQLRQAQAIEALNHAVALDKDHAFAHSQLGAIYQEIGFLDLALEHNRAYLALLRKARLGADATEETRGQLTTASEMLDRQSAMLAEREAEFDKSASGMKVLDRALTAQEMGLAGRARDILAKSDISAFGANGLSLELELFLRTGRARETRDWTSPEQQAALGANYNWLRARALAATGSYDLARLECTQHASEGEELPGNGPRFVAAVSVVQSILDGHRTIDHPGSAAWTAFAQAAFRNRLTQMLSRIRREADATALRGLLALEAGDTRSAVRDFRTALDNYGGNDPIANQTGVDFNARFMCQKLLEWIESVDPEAGR